MGAARAQMAGAPRMTAHVIVVGAGTAGLAAAAELAGRGARVTLVEKSARIGGTLHVSAGQMSAAGTKLQRGRGIVDSPEAHFADAMRISKGTADAAPVAPRGRAGPGHGRLADRRGLRPRSRVPGDPAFP